MNKRTFDKIKDGLSEIKGIVSNFPKETSGTLTENERIALKLVHERRPKKHEARPKPPVTLAKLKFMGEI